MVESEKPQPTVAAERSLGVKNAWTEVLIELYDRTPAASGATVVVRREVLPKQPAERVDALIADWLGYRGFGVRVREVSAPTEILRKEQENHASKTDDTGTEAGCAG